MNDFVAKHRLAWLAFWVVVMVALDQGTKLWAQSALVRPDSARDIAGDIHYKPGPPLEVIDGLFAFRYAQNPSAAFSLGNQLPIQYRRPALVALSCIAVVLLTVWSLRLKQRDALLSTAFAWIVSGAIGNNLIDRARQGYVIDFIDVYIGADAPAAWLRSHLGTNHWPTFNIADICVVVGALAVMFRSLKPIPEASATAAAETIASPPTTP